MLLLFTTCQSATTGSRSSLHRSVLYFFTFIHYSQTLSKCLWKKIEFVWAFSGDGLAESVHSVPLQVKQSKGRSTIWGLVLPIIWRQNRDPLFKLLAADRIRLNNDAVTLYCAIACALVMTLTQTDTDTGRVDYKYLEQRHDMFDISGYH